MRFGRVLLPSAAFLFLTLQSPCQDVIAAHAGVVHFSEGAVFLDDHALDQKPATYPEIKAGSTLRTEKGRAEVLLTPGVFLRLDENSAIRMVSNALTDTRLEFLRGSTIIDTMEAPSAPKIVLVYNNSQVRFPKQGIYRLDSDTDALQAYSGTAEVTPRDGKPAEVDTTHYYFFALDLETRKFADSVDDEFYDWAKDRSDAIASENQLAAQSAGDASDFGGNPLGGDPNPGIASPSPYFGGSPLYSYNYPDSGYWFGNTFYSGVFPFGYPQFVTYIFPVVAVGQGRGQRSKGIPAVSRWPRGTRNPIAISGSIPSSIGISRVPAPSQALRYGSVIPVRPASSGYGIAAPRYSRPVVIAPSRPAVIAPSRPAVSAPHAVVHR